MNSNSSFKESIAPTLVLVIICFVITLGLVATYGITKPIIDTNQAKANDIARTQVVPNGDSFSSVDANTSDVITSYDVANNKAGVAITSTAKSFGGTITVMTGMDQDGKITGVKVTNHSDTPGLGTKAMTPEYLEGTYNGKDASAFSADAVKDSGLDYIVGASISSNGIYNAVKEAVEQFQNVGGVN